MFGRKNSTYKYVNTASVAHDADSAIAGHSSGVSRRALLGGAATIGASAALLTDINGGAKAQSVAIPIGTMNPLTGPAAVDGTAGVSGLELAIKEINEAGGILGRPLELVSVDTKSMSAEEVVSAANLLIDRYNVHAILTAYNIGPNDAEYEPIADAGIIYMHANTAIQHVNTVQSDPERYFGCFMTTSPETFYGTNFPYMLAQLRDSGAWTPPNNKIALIVGSLPYSIVVAEEIKKAAGPNGFEVVFEEVVPVPTTEWGAVLNKIRALEPAAIANTHFFAGDLANCQLQFIERPINALFYYQYGALLQSFSDIAKEAGVGVLTSTNCGVLPDAMGKEFAEKMHAAYGPNVNLDPASFTYNEMYHYAIAASLAGGTGEPGNFDQNRKIAANLSRFPYRGVGGAIAFKKGWQSATPYPVYEKDPSLGLPQLTFQIAEPTGKLELVLPSPYNTGSFKTPSWFKV